MRRYLEGIGSSAKELKGIPNSGGIRMLADADQLILAVDPGREKCGLALVSRRSETVFKEVVPRGEITRRVAAALAEHAIGPVVVGDRTGSKEFRTELGAIGLPSPAHPVVAVNEHMSSQEARVRYLRDHPGRGLARFLPVTLRAPDVPIDDYVAVILAERYLQSLESEKR
jgi:RNase H-fold protein (predicted Holliday junction resolvase)